jgi:hypothetical protein
MKNIPWRLFAGGMLLFLGGLMLLQTLNIFPAQGDFGSVLVSVFFLGGGSVFLMVFMQNRYENWWAVIPGFVLFAIGLLIFGNEYFPRITDQIGGGLFLGSIALAFWVVYLLNHQGYWWALIPAGVLTTLSLIAIEPVSRLIPAEFLFFIGLSATFAIVALLVKPRENYSWAWIPSGILFAVAMIIGMFSSSMQLVFPIILILAGIIVLAVPYAGKLLKRGENEQTIDSKYQ